MKHMLSAAPCANMVPVIVDRRTGRRYYTAADVARRWGISPEGVRLRHSGDGRLRFIRVGRHVLVSEADLLRYEADLRRRITERVATLQAWLEALDEPLG